MKFNETEVRKTIEILKPNNQLFEIRHIYSSGKTNFSGYFKTADDLIKAMSNFTPLESGNTYITLNEIEDACYSRKQQNHFEKNPKETTADVNIVGYDWLMIDLDPERPSGTSSSNEELEKAHGKAKLIFKYLRNVGFNEPVIAMSGNGYHLLYRINLQNTAEVKKLIENCLKCLNMLFANGDGVDIDLKVFNPARICKLYGTMSEKGTNTEDRPHRMSKIVYVPNKVDVTDIAYLQKLVDVLPKESERPQNYNNYNPQSFDLDEWIIKHGVEVTDRIPLADGGMKYILKECPFNPNHNGKDACLIKRNSGAIVYKCLHNSCADNDWKAFRQMFEPDAYEHRDYHKPNREMYFKPKDTFEYITDSEEQPNEPYFYSIEDIVNKPTPPDEYIKTGIREIDKKLKGLRKGAVTVLSGLRASGKSSIISQISLNACEQGYTTLLYSGEMSPKTVVKWLVSQSAGKQNMVEDEKYENFFYPSKGVAEKVYKWLNGRIFLYNNFTYGDNFALLLSRLQDYVNENRVDLLILDNLMTLDISDAGYQENQQQTAFLNELTMFARNNNVHIIFAAHPRKASQFLRLSDISGTSNIGNKVDNALIIHRNNRDFQKLSAEYFSWSMDNDIYKASNVIEIAKDRENGNQDVFIPLFFENSTKRLKNEETESTNNFEYCWNLDDDIEEIGADVPW